jgi:hypothetical protein
MPEALRKHIRNLRELERAAVERGALERASELALIRKGFEAELSRKLEALGEPPEPTGEE